MKRKRHTPEEIIKKLVADLSLDKAILKEIAEGKWQARSANEKPWCMCGTSWK